MAEFPATADILEQILLRLDVEDLIRCKSVCKSWLTFISHARFIKTHLNYSYNDDRIKNKYGHRRRTLPRIPGYTTSSSYWPLCCGFGYDSSADDYKVVAGMRKSEYETCFLMLSFKSNVWEVIGEVKYMFCSKVGVLCNGALHWVMYHQNQNTSDGNRNKNAVIVSFDLSQRIFKEIPQPDDDPLYQSLGVGVGRRGWRYKTDMTLGIMVECLCIFPITSIPHHNIWIMNRYNVKGSGNCGST
ncbi:hypothetical protein L1987_81483 [Smallanthus sonchifolius]|uniref:Uncharacterized protein n=1 Tax=Smallanthus sonchifolius TaxID=185202 RepID=A0ACB8YRT6_9ASTR|nr:hypothetical protein L1987_81483 [Smallanthus sonchifolius]